MKTRAELAAAYVAEIGYDPFADDPAISETEVAEILAEHALIAFNEEWNPLINAAALAGDVAEVERLMLAQGEAFAIRFPS